jgi:hypothetical protein
MRETIIKLRQKPKHVRENIALGASAGMMILVAAMWIWQLPSSLGQKVGVATTVNNTETQTFGTFFGELKEQVASAGEAFNKATTTENPEVERPPAGANAVASSTFKASSTTPARPVRLVPAATTSSTSVLY